MGIISQRAARSARGARPRPIEVDPIDAMLIAVADTGRDLADDTFDRASPVRDWRLAVPPAVRALWPRLSLRERVLVSEVAARAALARGA